ncbi:MAG: AAA family ATPase [Sphingobium sp.]
MNDLATQPRLNLGDGPRGHAPLTNMGLALRTLLECEDAGADSPRMGLFHGFSGYGKTVAAGFVSARTNAAYVQAQSVWSQRSLLEAIAEELGITRLEKTAPKILRQIIDQLNHEPRHLIIDEMDHLVHKRSVEIIRDIHDATQIAILMIGEEEAASSSCPKAFTESSAATCQRFRPATPKSRPITIAFCRTSWRAPWWWPSKATTSSSSLPIQRGTSGRPSCGRMPATTCRYWSASTAAGRATSQLKRATCLSSWTGANDGRDDARQGLPVPCKTVDGH